MALLEHLHYIEQVRVGRGIHVKQQSFSGTVSVHAGEQRRMSVLVTLSIRISFGWLCNLELFVRHVSLGSQVPISHPTR